MNLFNRECFAARVYGVTGAAHGIGEETARQLATLGARVILIDKDDKNLHRVKTDLRAHHDSILCFHGDVRNTALIKRSIQTAKKKWGRIDGWVNNAMKSAWCSIENQTSDDFAQTWRVNTLAAWQSTKFLLPHFKDHGGSIVNVSSVMSHFTLPYNMAYTSSKAALEGLTRAMAVELGPRRIRINTVVPGGIRTKPSPTFRCDAVPPRVLKRYQDILDDLDKPHNLGTQPWPVVGRPHDVAHAILFLLSDASSFINGECLAVDGGITHEQPALFFEKNMRVCRGWDALKRLVKRYPALNHVKEVRHEPRRTAHDR